MKRAIMVPLLAVAFLTTVAATGDKATYTVKEGDSLWKISEGALDDPLLWPSIWKLNPYIKDPNLIYPGEVVTLPVECPSAAAESGPEVTAATEAAKAAPEPVAPPAKELFAYTPKVLAISSGDPSIVAGDRGASLLKNQPPVFVGPSLPVAAIVLGSTEGATAIAPGMTVSLDRGTASGIFEGQNLWVVHPDRQIVHPTTGRPVGWLYRTVAEIHVDCLTEEGASAGIVTFFDVITKGDLCLTAVPGVGEGLDLTPAFHGMCVPANPSLVATILAPVNDHAAIVPGERLIIDRGAETGLNPGDRLLAIQDSVPSFGSETGAPVAPQPLGEVIVLTTMPRLATGILVSATKELTSGTSLVLLP